jgi:hypothetical protein
MTARSRQRMLRDRKKLHDSLRAYKAGEIPAIEGEGERHFIESIERRLKSLNGELHKLEAGTKQKRKGRRQMAPPQLHANRSN